MMSDKTEGVLAVLRKEIEHAGCLGPRASDARAKRLTKVADAVAELLAADEELDDARIAACQTSVVTPLDQFTAVMDRFYAAQQRRAAAIRAMRGES